MFHLLKEEFNNKLIRKVFVVFLMCATFFNYAQVFYSTNPDYIKIKIEKNNVLLNFNSLYPDTSLADFQNYFPRNFMGNTGLPSPEYVLKYGTSDIGFRFVPEANTNDRFSEDQIVYVKSKGPYANLTGIAGSKQLQIFKLFFTHTYNDKINFTLKFNRYTSQGFYKKQQTYVNNVFFTSNYTSNNKRSGYYFYVLNNGNKNQENGGIKDIQLSDSSLLLNKDLFQTNLSGATRDNRQTKAMFNPWLRLNKMSDSLTKMDHFLQLKSKASFNSYKYKDPNLQSDNYYNLFYLDTALTLDSSNFRQFSNEISYTLKSKKNDFGLSMAYKNEINKVWQKKDSLFYNHILQSEVFYLKDFLSKDSLHSVNYTFDTRLSAQYILAGSNSGNYKVESNSQLFLNPAKNKMLYFNLLYEQRNADYIYNNWVSNHFMWLNNGYKPQEQLQAKLGLNLSRLFSVSVFYQNIYNYLYFDNIATPRQYGKTLTNLGLSLTLSKIVFKHLGVSLNHTFQSTSNISYVRIPQNISMAKLFYNGNLFKNNLQLQLGAQAQLYQNFYSYAYSPSTQAFYLQSNFQTARYPYVDFYLNARIHPVSIFLKVENALQGLVGTNYAFVPGYYQTDRAFRFGISWMFFD